MRRLEQFLRKECDSFIRSKTSNSLYFTFDNVVVRLSDHINSCGQESINIIYPLNDNNSYCVTLGTNIYIFSGREAFDFVINSVKYLKLAMPTPIRKPETPEMSEQPIDKTAKVPIAPLEEPKKIEIPAKIENRHPLKEFHNYTSAEWAEFAKLNFGKIEGVNNTFKMWFKLLPKKGMTDRIAYLLMDYKLNDKNPTWTRFYNYYLSIKNG